MLLPRTAGSATLHAPIEHSDNLFSDHTLLGNGLLGKKKNIFFADV
jgi:hypothetical protein